MEDVAHDRHREAVDPALLVAHGEQIEQRLRRVLVRPVARVDDGGLELVGDPLRNPRDGVPDDHGVRVHRVERARRVEDALVLLETRGARREVDHVRREALAGDLEARPRARARLEEEVHDGAAPQRRDLLHLALADLAHALGRVEDALDVAALEVFDAEQIPADHASPSGPTTTTSSGGSSPPPAPWSRTTSPGLVGRFFPT